MTDDLIPRAEVLALVERMRDRFIAEGMHSSPFVGLCDNIRTELAALPTGQGEGISSIDFQQRRGAAMDAIDEAIEAYRSYMLDDDYNPKAALDRIIDRLSERRAALNKGD